MGTTYSLIPLSVIISKPEDVQQLTEMGVNLPFEVTEGRFPTPKELLNVLTTLSGYIVDDHRLSEKLEIFVSRSDDEAHTHDSAILWIDDYQGNDAPANFKFYRGNYSLVVKITQLLAKFCGPFLLTDADNFEVVDYSGLVNQDSKIG